MTDKVIASDQVERPVERVGSLSSVPLAQIIRKVATESKSGDLQVICGRTIKTVYFDRGFIVFSASNLASDRLGESLIEFGRISRHEFAMASMLMKTSKRKLGQVLVDSGLMSEEELGRQVGLQVNKIVLSLFKESEGIYSFDERPCIIPMNLMVSLSVYRILLEGIRRMTSGRLIMNGLPSLATVVRVNEQPPFTFEFDKLKPTEQAVLRAAGKGATLADVVKRVQADRGRVLRSCYGLYAAGLIESLDAGAPARPRKVQEETGVFLLSDIERKFAQVRATSARQEVLMEFDRLQRVPESELLQIDRSVQPDPQELEKAFAERRREWERKRTLVENERSLVMKVDEIQKRLQEAYERLHSQAQSRAAEPPASLNRPAGASPFPKPVAVPPAPQAPSEAPPVVESTSAPTLSMADEEILSEFAETTSAPGTPPPGGAPAPENRAPENEPIAPALSEVQRQDRSRQLLRDVQLHFQVKDFEGAISLLYELIQLNPGIAAYHAMLAKAMMRHPVMSKNAERHFVEAIRLDPENADLHYALGIYYKAFGLQTRAYTEFRAAVRIDPRHEKARKQLLSDGKKDTIKDMFRKIFG